MIGDSIDFLPQQLPKQIDVLRLYSNFPKNIPDARKISSIAKSVEDRYRENSVRFKGTETIRLKLKRLVKSCKDLVSKRKLCSKSHTERQKQEKFQQTLYNLFDVSDNSSANQATNSSINSSASSSSSSHQSDFSSSCDDQNLNSDGFYPDSDPDDFDPDYDPSKDFLPSIEKKPISISLLKKISDSRGSFRLCENLLNVGVKITGGDPIDYGISKSSIWSKLTKLRSSQTNKLLKSLADDTCKIILQFDGKSCSRLNQRQQEGKRSDLSSYAILLKVMFHWASLHSNQKVDWIAQHKY